MKEKCKLILFSSVGIGSFVLCSGLCLFSIIIFITLGVDRVPIAIYIANNTDETVIIEIENRMRTVRSGEVIEMPWFRNVNARIIVHIGSDLLWEFHWKFSIPQTYLVQDCYYVQLERNATLYVLPYKIDSPVKNLPLQPSGYPLLASIQRKEKATKEKEKKKREKERGHRELFQLKLAGKQRRLAICLLPRTATRAQASLQAQLYGGKAKGDNVN